MSESIVTPRPLRLVRPPAPQAAPVPALRMQRFTIDGDAELERHLAEVCGCIAEGVKEIIPAAQLDGLLLGGGYGRGEGGVLRTDAGDLPYNDMEFYVFVHGSVMIADRQFGERLRAFAAAISPWVGVEVEFKIINREKIRRSGTTMFFYDLASRHRRILGDASLLAGCEHQLSAGSILPHEATRLLFNRCSGLLFAAERLKRAAFTSADADFVNRNLAKAQLAFGDALLAAHGLYHWSCWERHARLARAKFPFTEKVRGHHIDGVVFKLRPEQPNSPRGELAARHAELVSLAADLWLHIEGMRLGKHFTSTRDYALSHKDKCPETPGWRNFLVSMRAFGARHASSRYPRERLFHALALLLWENDPLRNPAVAPALSRELLRAPKSFSDAVAAYERLWHRFN